MDGRPVRSVATGRGPYAFQYFLAWGWVFEGLRAYAGEGGTIILSATVLAEWQIVLS